MARTVVYQGPTTLAGEGAPADTYREKLVKYVPAEVLAVIVLLATGAEPIGDWAVGLVAILGLVFTPIYLGNTASGLPADQKPRRHFYVLATLAFIPWILGTSDAVRETIGLEDHVGEWILGLAAFAIPGIDGALSRDD